MTTQNIRLFLLAAIAFVSMMLYNTWEQERSPKLVVHDTKGQVVNPQAEQQAAMSKDIPGIVEEEKPAAEKPLLESNKEAQVSVKTDVLNLVGVGLDLLYRPV